MKFIKKHIWLILVIALNFAVVLYPVVLTSLPITQTDGLTYFMTSKYLAETGDFFAELPDYIPAKGDEATHINEFLPVPIVYMALMIKITGERFVLNGGALGLLFVLSNIYLYLFAEKLTNNKAAALVTTLLSAISFRFYYLFWGGNWANVCAMILSVPALYYALDYLRGNKIKDLILMSVFLLLTAGSHTVHFLFTALLIAALFIGVKVLKNTELKLPEIKLKVGSLAEKTLKSGVAIFLIVSAAFLVTFIPFALAGTRTYWVSEWINYMLALDKVPNFWHYGAIADCSIIIILGMLELIYAIYKQKWEIATLGIMSFVIVNITNFLVPDDVWLSLFIYRYQAFHFIVLALLSSYFAFEISSKEPKLRKLMIALMTLAVLSHVAKTGYVMYKIEPAITEDEYSAVEYMQETGEGFWLINNIETDSSFRSYEWILAYGDSDKTKRSEEINTSALAEPYIIVQDTEALSSDELTLIKDYEEVAEFGTVTIFKK